MGKHLGKHLGLKSKMVAGLLDQGFTLIFDRDPWTYLQKDEILFCIHETGYEKRTIINGGRSPSEIEYREFEDDME